MRGYNGEGGLQLFLTFISFCLLVTGIGLITFLILEIWIITNIILRDKDSTGRIMPWFN